MTALNLFNQSNDYKTYLKILRDKVNAEKLRIENHNQSQFVHPNPKSENAVLKAPIENVIIAYQNHQNRQSINQLETNFHRCKQCRMCRNQLFQRKSLEKLNSSLYKSANQTLHAKYLLNDQQLITKFQFQTYFRNSRLSPIPPPNSRMAVYRNSGTPSNLANDSMKYQWNYVKDKNEILF